MKGGPQFTWVSLATIIILMVNTHALSAENSDSHAKSEEQHIIKKRQLLGIDSIVGVTVAAAKALWVEANAERRWAKIIIHLTNYSKWRLTKPIYKQVSSYQWYFVMLTL